LEHLSSYSHHCSYLVEVVADARQNFASSNVSLLPSLPVAPGPQTRRPSLGRSNDNLSQLTRPSRRAVPANQIFQVEEDSSPHQGLTSSTPAKNDHRDVVPTDILPVVPLQGPGRSAFMSDSPRPTRRATVLARSPEKPQALDIDVDNTPSRRREKSKSANDLKRLIRPISKVQFELDKREPPRCTTLYLYSFLRVVAAKSSLSAVLDRDLFTPDPVPIDPDTSGSLSDHVTGHSPAHNSLTDSPFLVHPYPSRKQAATPPVIDSPTQRHLEGVYDRLLMATSSVKRVGKGYQSCHVKPISINVPSPSSKSPGRFFHSTRRPMPPPVSSEDKFMTSSADEFGVMLSDNANVDGAGLREDRASTAKAVSRALKAIVIGRTGVKKASRSL
jgi:serine/threonine-protein kinase GIN4